MDLGIDLTRTVREWRKDRHRNMGRKAGIMWIMNSEGETPAGA